MEIIDRLLSEEFIEKIVKLKIEVGGLVEWVDTAESLLDESAHQLKN